MLDGGTSHPRVRQRALDKACENTKQEELVPEKWGSGCRSGCRAGWDIKVSHNEGVSRDSRWIEAQRYQGGQA